MTLRGLEGFEGELARQHEVLQGRSPAYARAVDLLPGVLDGAPGRRLADAWAGRRFFAWYDRPLLLLAALRDRALALGPAHPLGFAFSDAGDATAVTAGALGAALDGSRPEVFESLARRQVQTNETSRAVAWLWPAAILFEATAPSPPATTPLPPALALVDIGASAGLNLAADQLPAPWTFEDGSPVPVARGLEAAARLGLDASPLDVGREEDARWLRACIWPGELPRLERLEAAMAAFRAMSPRQDAPVLAPLAVRSVPARLDLLSAADPGTVVLAYQTVVRDYLAPDERADYEAGMRAWIATHPPGRAIWVELEGAPGATGPGDPAAITAHVRAPGGPGAPGGGDVETVLLARSAWHPGRLQRVPGAEARLRYMFSPPSTSTQRPSK